MKAMAATRPVGEVALQRWAHHSDTLSDAVSKSSGYAACSSASDLRLGSCSGPKVPARSSSSTLDGFLKSGCSVGLGRESAGELPAPAARPLEPVLGVAPPGLWVFGDWTEGLLCMVAVVMRRSSDRRRETQPVPVCMLPRGFYETSVDEGRPW